MEPPIYLYNLTKLSNHDWPVDFSIAGGHRGHLACADAAPRKKKRGGVPDPTLKAGR